MCTIVAVAPEIDDDSSGFKPKVLFRFLFLHGVGRNNRITPWLFFTVTLICGCGQIVTDLSNGQFTIIYKLIFLCNFLNQAVSLFLTVYHRARTTRLCEDILSQLESDEKSVVKRNEKIISSLLLIFFLILFATVTIFEVIDPSGPNYILTIPAPVLMWISFFTCKLFVTFFSITVYLNCFIFILSLVGLSLARSHRLQRLKVSPRFDSQLIMKELTGMIESFKTLEQSSSLAVFQMIASHFFEITLFLYRQISYEASVFPFRIIATLLVMINVALVLYCCFVVSQYQEKVKQSAEQLLNSPHLDPHTMQGSVFFKLHYQIRTVSNQSLTALNVINIDRKLILALSSSFLPIAVLFVQMDHA